MTLWEVDIYPAAGRPDLAAQSIQAEAADLGIADRLSVKAARGYLLEGELSEDDVRRLAKELLADPVVEETVIGKIGAQELNQPPADCPQLIHVLPKPGVMDPVAQSALKAIADFDIPAENVRTLKKYWTSQITVQQLELLCGKILANDSIEQVVVGPMNLQRLDVGQPYTFELVHVPISQLDDTELERLSREGQLYLTLVEMQTIQQYFRELDRDPTDVELETIAQTWSEHCSHKTLAGRIAYRDERGERQFDNMLKETIFAATQTDSRATGRAGLVRQRLQRQRGHRPVRRPIQRCLQSRNAQSPVGVGALRRSQHGDRRRDPRSDGHGPGRQAGLQHRRLLFCLRPTRRPRTCRPACCIRGAS